MLFLQMVLLTHKTFFYDKKKMSFSSVHLYTRNYIVDHRITYFNIRNKLKIFTLHPKRVLLRPFFFTDSLKSTPMTLTPIALRCKTLHGICAGLVVAALVAELPGHPACLRARSIISPSHLQPFLLAGTNWLLRIHLIELYRKRIQFCKS